MPIGCKVTLRAQRMYEFLDRLITVALPRVRDFRGYRRRALTARQLRARAQGAAGVPRDRLRQGRQRARNGCRHLTTAKTDDEARALLKGFQMPFTN